MIFESDKRQHMIGSACEVLIIGSFFGLAVGVMATLIIGLAKEWIYDGLLHRGNCDPEDMIADVIGSILGALLLVIIVRIL